MLERDFTRNPPASAVGVAFTFAGRSSALPVILRQDKGTTIFRNTKEYLKKNVIQSKDCKLCITKIG